jgi:hypothetical protein
MISWKQDFKIHLHFLSRFLNHNLPPEVRWLNGYRVLEWQFCRGKAGLSGDKEFRAFLEQYGAGFDPFLSPKQTRHGLIEQTRAQAAHALLFEAANPKIEGASVDLILKTFAALESLVIRIMNQGVVEGCTFFPNPSAQ